MKTENFMNKKNSNYKKKLGYAGENTLDNWMQFRGWQPIFKNYRIHKGEIDRVYQFKNNILNEFSYCVAEVKSTIFFTQKDFDSIYSEVGIKKFVKQHQIQNLYKYGEHLNSCLFANLNKKVDCVKTHSKIFLRLFIVAKLNFNLNNNAILMNNKSIKCCEVRKNYCILSIEPEFTTHIARKSLLQIKI